MKAVCVYCGSADDLDGRYIEVATQMGAALAARGLQLVFGGGRTGLMGAVADATLVGGGEVIGVIPEQFNTMALAHNDLTRLEVVADMPTRKTRMIELADGFIALPGGFGTMEEFFETLAWAQIGLHRKPLGLLNAYGFYDQLLAFLAHANHEGFTFGEHQQLYRASDDPEELLDEFEHYQLPEGLERWWER